MGIDPRQLRELVIRPACEAIGLWSPAAEELLLGTACQESRCGQYLRQLGGGPALGIFQMEPATFSDLWDNFLGHGGTLAQAMAATFGQGKTKERMVYDLRFAAAMCRVHYYRVRAPLPASGDTHAQAAYWKKYYNTVKGAGTVEEYLRNWKLLGV